MIQQTKDAAQRVTQFLDTRDQMGGPIDKTVVHCVERRGVTAELTTADLRLLVEALTSPIGELFRYSEWLDSQSIIRADAPVLDDSGNETGDIDDRSHEQLVRDFLEES